MLPMEVVDRVFRIAAAGAEGTAFALDVNGRQYLVTAKHLVAHIAGSSWIELYHDHAWRTIEVDLVGHSDVDISVLAPAAQVAHEGMTLRTTRGGFYVGQDAYFVGFPLDLTSVNVESKFPAPLLKKAIISGAAGAGMEHAFYLDGHNNVGFSGGPVYLQLPGTHEYVVAMVVASFIAQREPVRDALDESTELSVLQNSGIIAAYNIGHALDLIERNPVGLKLARG